MKIHNNRFDAIENEFNKRKRRRRIGRSEKPKILGILVIASTATSLSLNRTDPMAANLEGFLRIVPPLVTQRAIDLCELFDNSPEINHDSSFLRSHPQTKKEKKGELVVHLIEIMALV